MKSFKPATPYNVPLKLLVPTYTKVQGVTKKTFPSVDDGILFFGSFKTYGGTEITVDGLYSVVDTASVETWYRPEINTECRIAVLSTGAVYEIINEPENINMRNQYLRFKVRRVKGGA